MKTNITQNQTLINYFRLSLRAVFSMMLIFLIGNRTMSQTVNILVSPATSTVTLNQTFSVDVLVDVQSGTLSGIDAYVNFNPTYLQVLSTTVPSSTQTLLPAVSVPIAFNNTLGRVDHGRFTSSPTGHPNSDFVLFSIQFQAIGIPPGGNTPITFNVTGVRETNAVEGFNPDILNLITGGTVILQNCTPPTGTIAAAAASSTVCNGQPIGLRLASATGVSPYSLVVNGTTYSGVTTTGTFATIPFPSYKIWPSTTPTGFGAVAQNDGTPIEVGTKFVSTQTGFVKGVRFYSGSGAHTISGTFKGKLWNFTTGALLGTVNFTGVTKGAWQEVMFATPISIAANTTYIITSYSSAGYYVATDGYFSSGVTNGPLTALANSVSTNGMYFSGTEQAGPVTNFGNWGYYLSANYWVDVIFTPNMASFALTSITDANGCTASGSPLQTLNITSVDCSSLPVTLLNLSATPGASKVSVRWTTSSEINNLGFDVQRSTNGSSWTTLGFVDGAGNSSTTKNYSYLDNNLEPRKYFYRLKQIDIDQHYKYSSIVTATLNGKAEFILEQNFPNPFTSQTTIQFTVPRRETVNISLFDMNGRVLKTLVNGSKDAGSHVINLNIGTLPKGVYYYKMQAGDFSDVKKLTIQ